MNRAERRRNKLLKELRAAKMLNLETSYGNRTAGSIKERISGVDFKIAQVKEILQLNPNDFVTKEFIAELEHEKRELVNMTLKQGCPKTYLKELFEKQKSERSKPKSNE